MSYSSRKAALFGQSDVDEDTSPSNNNIASKYSSSSSSSHKPRFNAKSGLNSIEESKKINEAKEHVKKAEEYLKVTMFKWSADHLGAASYFTKAALCYKVAGELKLAYEMYMKSGNSNDEVNAFGASAQEYSKAAEICVSLNDIQKAIDTYKLAGQRWGTHGHTNKYAEMLILAAKICLKQSNDNDFITKAREYYEEALDMICPNENEDLSGIKLAVTLPEVLRDVFTFYIRNQFYKEAIALAMRSLPIFEFTKSDSTLTKMMVNITILQLLNKDIVAADETYVQKFLSNSLFINSSECELAEDLINAFKFDDIDKLESIQNGHRLSFLERDIIIIVRGFSLTTKNTSTSNKNNNNNKNKKNNNQEEENINEDEDEIDLT